MPEEITSERLLHNVMETLSDGLSRQRSGSFFEEEVSKSVNSKFNKLFGRQKPVHHVLGGGKCRVPILYSWRDYLLCSAKDLFVYIICLICVGNT